MLDSSFSKLGKLNRYHLSIYQDLMFGIKWCIKVNNLIRGSVLPALSASYVMQGSPIHASFSGSSSKRDHLIANTSLHEVLFIVSDWGCARYKGCALPKPNNSDCSLNMTS